MKNRLNIGMVSHITAVEHPEDGHTALVVEGTDGTVRMTVTEDELTSLYSAVEGIVVGDLP